ncbi:hypothetical protein Q757_02295 [Oenococcus alcoholitolerans]|uniref:GFO/IDH/MocA-like oxidoreductase domain-containing protein n=1 Tax=Oenococcus alcoholitolerans TaxID=931074 RepID=A0ABR4XRW9_9LACO|nr:hypothetical protein Q757_02295 [Oenococcus alcoholitolerans]
MIGKIITFKSTFGHGGPENWSVEKGPDTWFFNKARSKFGAIFDLGVHKIDLIRFILNDEIKKVTSRSFTLDKRKSDGSFIDVDDNSIGIYEFESGVVGTITSSWTYYGEEDNSTIFYGDKGLLKIYDDPKYSIKAFLLNGDRIDYDIDHIQTNESQTNSGVIDNFVDSLINKKSSVLEAVEILGSMRAVFAGIESNNNNDTENVGN